MHPLYTTLQCVLDILFPRNPTVTKFDTVTSDMLAQHSLHAETDVSFRCIAPLSFRAPLVRDAIHAAKYHNHLRAAAVLAEAAAPYVAEELADLQMFGAFTTPIVLSVPLHPTRQRERTYNQSARIAAALAVCLSLPYTADNVLLTRHKQTPSQTKQASRTDRIRSMNGAFAARSNAAGQDVILVDDVVTTGATLGAAREALMKAGARDVVCVAIAH